ncbi:MAG: toxin [Elusimicrobiota bacterium]|nr:toxin [Elusimicrobiota bacterium]
MKLFEWNNEKNNKLKEERGISFEDVLYYVDKGDILDIVLHPQQDKYPDQKMFIMVMENYVYLVPFIETKKLIFLKTIIPSAKLQKSI